MKYRQEICKIEEKRQIAPKVFDITVHAPGIACKAVPGQFVTVFCDGYTLRRPISICGIDSVAGTLRLVFEVRGEGTAWMAEIPKGGSFDLIGPLGRGFDVKNTDRKAIFVGGGIGVPPLLAAARLFGENAAVILGFRSSVNRFLEEDFKQAGASVYLATEDGSMGYHGLVTEVLAEHLCAEPCDVIYTCGPVPMLKGVASIAEKYQIPCQVSMEQRMACGVGACLVCACQTLTPTGQERYAQVCKNGPVFDAKEVVW